MNHQRGFFTFFDALIVIGIIAGIFIGHKCGLLWFGTTGAIGIALVGGAMGYIVARLPWVFANRSIKQRLEKEPSQQLRERLHHEYFVAHLILAQLMKRGEDISNELPWVIGLIKSEDKNRRIFGWSALKFAFPKIAAQIAEYRPTDSTERCRALASRLDLHVEPNAESLDG
ncbi:MAG: hypothetical protein FWF41_02765 [Betaproteobacteria bacterium]|nr:hypothetical protein [Betaproteobacteria bacterium]